MIESVAVNHHLNVASDNMHAGQKQVNSKHFMLTASDNAKGADAKKLEARERRRMMIEYSKS